MPYFDKILIANRGEIALRIMKTAQKLGVKTVAIYSNSDKASEYVKKADEAYYVGEGNQGYLNANKIIEIAKRSNAQAIHPGYGFLSENPQFAQLCQSNKIKFIGPSPQTMNDLSSKQTAKEKAREAGIPVIPGYSGDQQDIPTLIIEAKKIGFPLLVKAAYGGGGKGMKLVYKEEDLETALASGKREAKQFFDNDKVILEKYLGNTRHIEVQIVGRNRDNNRDSTGEEEGVCLYERDCSIQRRYQKIIEETPAPCLSESILQQVYEYSREIIKIFEYEGAGTVEFLIDITNKDKPSIYFMEVNTRLQVEHKITEITTGIDLVEWQMRIAAGFPIPRKQKDILKEGCGLETRIYAEQTYNDFLPSAGLIKELSIDKEIYNDKDIQLDIGIEKGTNVDISYDPMIAKLITKGKDRQEAIYKMKKALKGLQIAGIDTNIDFLYQFLSNPLYTSSNPSSTLLNTLYPQIKPSTEYSTLELALSAAMFYIQNVLKSNNSSPWESLSSFRNTLNLPRDYSFLLNKNEIQCKMMHQKNTISLYLPNASNCIPIEYISKENNRVYVSILESMYSVDMKQEEDQKLFIFPTSESLRYSYLLQPKTISTTSLKKNQRPTLLCPMPAKVIQMAVKEGEEVKEGDTVAIIEAMKMEHVLCAPSSGRVHFGNIELNTFINKDDLIAEIIKK
ncbi:hypothetical protein WA158_004178 [Blastocystis sp. Blastoise]